MYQRKRHAVGLIPALIPSHIDHRPPSLNRGAKLKSRIHSFNMRLEALCQLAIFGVLLMGAEHGIAASAKKPSRPIRSSRGRTSPGSGRPNPKSKVSSRRKPVYEEEEEDVDDFDQPGFLDADDDDEFEDDEDFEEEEEEEVYRPSRKPSRAGRPAVSRATREAAINKSNPRKRRPQPSYYDDDMEDDYGPPRSRRGPSTRSRAGARPMPRGKPGARRSGSMVPYTRHKEPSFLSRSLDAVKNSMPDPNTIREVASNSLNAARDVSSSLSANIYREIKGLTSSELEQVLLKATRPDDGAVKGKHVERLVSVTYQISPQYDIYDAVLRKLWSKMAEKDWRTKVKALYILHRFSADGAPEHAAALKARLRELRRTRDPKRKDKYFNSKQLLAGESKPENMKFRAFMSRYAHYVILRAQCFGGVFDEISAEPKADRKKGPKPITNTALRKEHLEAADMLFKAGLACQLKDAEECENTAIAAERVASDLIGLTAAVAMALNRVLKDDNLKGADPVLIKKWCELYKKQLLPKTKAHVKKLSSKLDAYGLFLPSRMGTSVSSDLLERGLNLDSEDATEVPGSGEDDSTAEVADSKQEEEDVAEEEADEPQTEQPAEDDGGEALEEEDEEASELEDEYEYEEEEFYDDEEE